MNTSNTTHNVYTLSDAKFWQRDTYVVMDALRSHARSWRMEEVYLLNAIKEETKKGGCEKDAVEKTIEFFLNESGDWSGNSTQGLADAIAWAVSVKPIQDNIIAKALGEHFKKTMRSARGEDKDIYFEKGLMVFRDFMRRPSMQHEKKPTSRKNYERRRMMCAKIYNAACQNLGPSRDECRYLEKLVLAMGEINTPDPLSGREAYQEISNPFYNTYPFSFFARNRSFGEGSTSFQTSPEKNALIKTVIGAATGAVEKLVAPILNPGTNHTYVTEDYWRCLVHVCLAGVNILGPDPHSAWRDLGRVLAKKTSIPSYITTLVKEQSALEERETLLEHIHEDAGRVSAKTKKM